MTPGEAAPRFCFRRIRKTRKVDFTYSAFGLLLHSKLSLPGLAPLRIPPSGPYVEIHLGLSPPSYQSFPDTEECWYTSPMPDPEGNPALRIWKVSGGEFLRLSYSDGTQFWIDRNRGNIWAVWAQTSSLEEAATYLYGPVLGLLLRLRGEICLHASAVALGERAVVFAGEAEAGKSTTAAAFARLGDPVLADDVVRLVHREGFFYVQPACPQVSLWPDSVEFLYGSPEALPRFSAAWEKRNLSLGQRGTRFEERALPVGAIYILGERSPEPAPCVSELSSQAALMALVASSYGTRILDPELRGKEFEFLARLATAVPVRQLTPHHDPLHLDQLCRVVREDFQALVPCRSGG